MYCELKNKCLNLIKKFFYYKLYILDEESGVNSLIYDKSGQIKNVQMKVEILIHRNYMFLKSRVTNFGFKYSTNPWIVCQFYYISHLKLIYFKT